MRKTADGKSATYLGDRRLKTADGIEVWPFEAPLAAVAGDRLWP